MDYPFRVQSAATSARRTQAIRAQGLGEEEPQAGDDPTQQYLARVIKLIPAEVVALYQGVYGVINSAVAGGDADAKSWIVWLPWVGLLLVIFVRCWGTRDSTGKFKSIQFGAVVIASVSFLIWVVSLGNEIAFIGVIKPWVGSILLMIWPFFVPYFYKGD